MGQGLRSFQVHAFLPVEDEQVFGFLDGLAPGAVFRQQSQQGLDFLAVPVAHHVGRVAFNFRGPRVEHNQGRAPLRGLLHPEPGQGRFLLQVAGHHQDDVSRTPAAGVMARTQAHLVRPVAAREEGVQHFATAQVVRQAGQIEEVFVAEPAGNQGDQVLPGLLEGLGDPAEGLLPRGGPEFSGFPH